MAPTAADVPRKYDVIINGVGYLFAPMDDSSALSGYGLGSQYNFSPTFVTRQNTAGDFGDNQQDFWLTATQRDWSLGESLRFMRVNDPVASRRYWDSNGVEVGKPGEVTIRCVASAITPAALPTAAVGGDSLVYFTTSTNLYDVTVLGAVSDNGAHGLGATPTCMTYDGSGDFYMAGASTGIRKWNGSAYSTFSSTTDTYVDLEYNNNTLYAITASVLYSFDTSGTRTEAFTWKGADGAAMSGNKKVVAFGGRLVILRVGTSSGSELWLYDGTGVSQIGKLPVGFKATDIQVLNGMVFVSGVTTWNNSAEFKPTIFYYANGSIDKLWESYSIVALTETFPLGVYNGGLVFSDITRANNPIIYYNPSSGGMSQIFNSSSVTTFVPIFASTFKYFMVLRGDGGTSGYVYPYPTIASSATIQTALFDFDSSLTKVFRGIKVEWEAHELGSGDGTVDIAYQIDGVSSYTTLQTTAVSGTEYTIASATGRSISVKVTLNKGASNYGPKLKKIAVRAAPKQASFRRGTYVLNLSSVDGVTPIQLRDGSFEPSDGLALATNLTGVVTTATPVTIIDELGTYTGVIEAESFELRRMGPHEFVGFVKCREV